MKLPFGSSSPLTAEPEVQQIILTEDYEFLIIACDGIWDIMSNHDAVKLIRLELRQHDDPQWCARALIGQSLRFQTTDNITTVVVCFTASKPRDSVPSQRPRFRCCSVTEEAWNKLRSLLEGSN